MNEKPASDWSDLARLWQAEAAAVSIEDIDAHLKRHRRHMRVATFAELAGACLGVAAAGWLAFFTTYRGLGLVVGAFALISATVIVRMRREPAASGSVDLLQSLKDSMDREDWIAEQLRFGRALSFVALFAIVSATGSQLRDAGSGAAFAMTAGGIAAACVLAALAWNVVLLRRSHARRRRLEYLKERFKP
jgi:hypothetical protein